MIELYIENKGVIYQPLIEGEITWETERKGSPGSLSFNVLKDATIDFQEGNAVKFIVDGANIFFGFVFNKKRSKDGLIKVTCYDQLRYLKNKDTYVYENKTANQVIQMIASDFGLSTGSLENTGFKIVSRVEDSTTLFDMIQNALDLTLQNKKEMYVLYDNFGKLTLQNISSMALDFSIDDTNCEDFDYTTSIDSNTYNKVKLIYENEETSKREIFISKDTGNINKWGVLQYFETLQEGENGSAKADALLKLYNQKTRNLSIKKVFGDIRVRAGSMIFILLELGDIYLNKRLLVEKCKHTFTTDSHFMDITLRGGEFVV